MFREAACPAGDHGRGEDRRGTWHEAALRARSPSLSCAGASLQSAGALRRRWGAAQRVLSSRAPAAWIGTTAVGAARTPTPLSGASARARRSQRARPGWGSLPSRVFRASLRREASVEPHRHGQRGRRACLACFGEHAAFPACAPMSPSMAEQLCCFVAPARELLTSALTDAVPGCRASCRLKRGEGQRTALTAPQEN